MPSSEFGLHWLRAPWLLALLPLLLAVLWWWRGRSVSSAWETYIDPALQPYVIEPLAEARGYAPLLLFGVWGLTIILLAGPVWQQHDVPVFDVKPAQVLILDLSPSMLTDDVKPNRLARARFKLIDFLAQSQGRQTGLIAFSERPYVISPLTDDAATVQAFVPSLSPDIMPVQGSRADLAIDHAVELLQQAGSRQGNIILISDSSVDASTIAAASNARQAGYSLSVLAVGTESGAPLRNADGQFVQDRDGAIVVPQLNMTALSDLATAGGGRAERMRPDSQDLDRLLSLPLWQSSAEQPQTAASGSAVGDGQDSQHQARYWIERSPLLLPLIALFALACFRRGLVQ